MEVSQWLGAVGISQIHPGDGKQHDGFIDVHVGVTFSDAGTKTLNEHLKAKVKGLDQVINTHNTIKLVASSKADGSKPNEGDLKKLANSAIRSLKAWASNLSAGDMMFCITEGMSEERIKAAGAVHSTTSTFHGADRSD